MATIQTFPVDHDDPQNTSDPFVRVSMDKGCSLAGCHCSPGYWISVSDGERTLYVNLTPEEGQQLLETGKLFIDNVVRIEE